MDGFLSPAWDRARAILLVDGSIRTRAPLADMLRTAGYEVFEAATADDALTLLNSRLDIDALITHEKVKGSMGGAALADWLQKTRPSLEVVLLSKKLDAADLLALLPPITPGP